jgi:hypothetical protein
MNEALLPFLTFFTPDPDMTAADLEREILQLNQRNQAIEQMLRGQLPPDVLFEMLYEDEIEPGDWVDDSLDNCGLIVYV